MSETTEEKEEKKALSEGEKPWLERQLEKIIGRQEKMQPIIRVCFSIAGFMAGFIAGNWVLGKEKDRRIETLTQKAEELLEENEELEAEVREAKKQLEESREKQMRAETELKVLKERQGMSGRELTGSPSFRAAQYHYLD